MNRPRRAFALNGRHVLMVFIGFFLIVFAVNGLMVYQALSTFGGLDTDDAYRKGLAYNDRIAAAATQSRLGWHDRTDSVAAARRLRVTLTDAAGAAVSGLKVRAVMQRPATDVFDRSLSLTQTGPDTYEADVSQLEPGAWTVDVQARRGGEGAALYEARRRLWIKP
jgi:nitrogen fixation protein FixH